LGFRPAEVFNSGRIGGGGSEKGKKKKKDPVRVQRVEKKGSQRNAPPGKKGKGGENLQILPGQLKGDKIRLTRRAQGRREKGKRGWAFVLPPGQERKNDAMTSTDMKKKNPGGKGGKRGNLCTLNRKLGMGKKKEQRGGGPLLARVGERGEEKKEGILNSPPKERGSLGNSLRHRFPSATGWELPKKKKKKKKLCPRKKRVYPLAFRRRRKRKEGG